MELGDKMNIQGFKQACFILCFADDDWYEGENTLHDYSLCMKIFRKLKLNAIQILRNGTWYDFLPDTFDSYAALLVKDKIQISIGLKPQETFTGIYYSVWLRNGVMGEKVVMNDENGDEEEVKPEEWRWRIIRPFNG
jgi:hypothetical protein